MSRPKSTRGASSRNRINIYFQDAHEGGEGGSGQ
jgi:hypothetical protein